ncbi:helix-turn-helix domain-containing protein [Coleofasciculus sp. FACHB-501]|uniref:helix-turn-helix domain-containing protein n=1 Tax=Cyanophyceae TaxID=3028117 RepID=UPI001688F7BD|nr:helix-turn-helix domain-containing protein [Coleofasciculus sp. FACHB-501]MBD1836627.1 helix-turn-helix domain-containing protein [Coleofasciculus sp. FACHB-501]
MIAIAEWQRSYILETAEAGRAAAKARGRSGGRPRKLNAEQIESAETRRQVNKKVNHLCKSLDISRATYYRRIHN